ncbi:hypothetical protein NDU88_001567 [Pleurodeles waltl]|uniref:Uncharacterized protein n=1 Tax=Pleurodeles waltl TaxID=8319 RepID=A0AAV7VXZ6_PLEWA|nr:hypothetical protein NDU88_001567 [Pleurodeles waltl]
MLWTFSQPALMVLDTSHTKSILEAIQASQEALKTKIGEVGVDVAILHQDLCDVVVRVSDAEGHIAELEVTIQELISTVHRLSASSKLLEECTEDAET